VIDPLQTGLPVAPDAERAVLGGILSVDGLFPQVSAVLDREDFSLEKHRRIFSAMGMLHDAGNPIDLVTLAAQLDKVQQLHSVDGVAYLAGLCDAMASIMGVDAYLRIVKDKSILRRYILGHQELINEALLNGDSTEILDRAERFNRELSAETVKDRRLLTAGEIIAREGGVNTFHEAARSRGVPTPWAWLTRVLGGWRPMELTIIAARPSVGKTAAALQVAEKAAQCGLTVAFFSLEMSGQQLLRRLICSRAEVDSQSYRRNELNREERLRLVRATGEVEALPIRYDDQTGCTVPAMHAAIRRLTARENVGLVVIDYLQLMTAPGRHGNRTEAVSTISRGLKLATRDFAIPFVVLSQLTRANEHESRRPMLSDLRESGSIEQDADNVIFLHPKDREYKPVRPVELIIAKQRNGSIGMTDMTFCADVCRLRESTEEHEPVDYRSRAAAG
jgi:replicative DNA helicase